MRILVAIVHYFRPEPNPTHASVDGAGEEMRRTVVQSVIQAYRGLYVRPAVLDVAGRRFQLWPGPPDQVDIALVTVPGCSIVAPAFLQHYGVATIEVRPDDPRTLGFAAHELFARLHAEYDMFVYTEDDLRPSDPDLFAKVAWFAGRSEGRRVLSPNRFEWNSAGPTLKTYIDGDLRGSFVDPLLALQRDVDSVEHDVLGRPRQFRRARNPHAGFFAVTQAQLGHWMRQPHWLDRDCGFVSPLESTATLGLAKTFPVFKPFGASAAFLELQHLDTRFSALRLPWESMGLAALASPPEATA